MMVMWAEPTSPSLHYYAPHQGFSNTLFEVACGDRRSVRQSEFVFLACKLDAAGGQWLPSRRRARVADRAG